VSASPSYYHKVADRPGEVFLYVDGPSLTEETVRTYGRLGVTWLASDVISARAFRRGEPRGGEARTPALVRAEGRRKFV
jgi:hypothetical protein